MNGPTPHRIATVGLASWDDLLVLDRFPVPGSAEIVRAEAAQSGGTTANVAAALARLGVAVTFAGMVGDDDRGRRLRSDLEADGVDVRHLTTRPGEPTDASVLLVSGTPPAVERTILWRQGARLRRGDFLPIEKLFAHDLVVVDVDDLTLRRLLVDLPMHVSPRTRLLGPLTYLIETSPEVGLDLALRHDYVVGNEAEFLYLTETASLDDAVTAFREQLPLSQTRFAVISRGARGCVLIGRDWEHVAPAFAVDSVDTTGAGDAFAAAVALGIVERRAPDALCRFANAVGALATRALGARAGLPTRDEAEAFGREARLLEVEG
ncbi:MAG TPA: carbohydrate kinase family protein [Thermomicrobiaceae bacterium]|nr:carbohydrate kinase family protein [Thermomicrobiaceae bacterium]